MRRLLFSTVLLILAFPILAKAERSQDFGEFVVHYNDLVNATRHRDTYGADLKRWVEVGASPRASLALDKCGRTHAWLNGRDYVDPEDVRAITPDVLRHRLTLSYEAQGEGVSADRVVEELIAQVALP